MTPGVSHEPCESMTRAASRAASRARSRNRTTGTVRDSNATSPPSLPRTRSCSAAHPLLPATWRTPASRSQPRDTVARCLCLSLSRTLADPPTVRAPPA
eukprot:341086-Rhodomonas_salina.2